MKKLIAFLFLSLLCLTNIAGPVALWDAGYEQQADCDDTDKENKEDKKELKEFTLSPSKNGLTALSIIVSYKVFEALVLPKPVIDKQTPPPNGASLV